MLRKISGADVYSDPLAQNTPYLRYKKYGVIRGITKAYVQLFKKCKGRIYSIDEP